jgi:hypothetical protein
MRSACLLSFLRRRPCLRREWRLSIGNLCDGQVCGADVLARMPDGQRVRQRLRLQLRHLHERNVLDGGLLPRLSGRTHVREKYRLCDRRLHWQQVRPAHLRAHL